MPIQLRGKQPGDEEAIDVVNYRAFTLPDRAIGGGMDEVELVRRLRCYAPTFDPRFSVTAWEGETLVGHTLFLPATIRLMGGTVRALVVGPVAVLPERQRRGIGGAMLRFGHGLGRAEGHELALLLGHPGYYPRHGYVPVYGFARITFDVDRLPSPCRRFTQLPVQSADLPWLVERGAAESSDVDFGWLWGAHTSEWTIPGVRALVWWTEDGERAAYTLSVGYRAQQNWKMVLAADPEIARDVIATIRPATLPQHPAGWLAHHALCPEWERAEVEASAVAAGRRLPGACSFALPCLLT